ncbi:TPA: hypothetical protein ACK21Z_005339 [Vibrio harveyi]|uniref:adenylosuccinate synthase n=2 Tax=Vibrio harveyi TaxID=669 RepID=UPI000C7B186F|nr:adenylosuccinate synthase [Vibrio harveyi]AWA97915.1 adenylosuccinate synthase [Vibrio harveyi]
MSKQWTHQELVDKAVKWLKKPHGQGGTGCHVAVSEFPTGYTGEIPDAIGFRAHTEYLGGSVVCEVKVSRSDFLADAKKPHRNGEVLGVGQHRFYVAPQGLIKPDELPQDWGLVEVTNRGGTKCIVGFPSTLHNGNRRELFEASVFEVDVVREMNVLIRLCSRIGDAEELNNIKRENNRLKKENDTLSTQAKKFEVADYLKELEKIEASPRPIHLQRNMAKNRINRLQREANDA